MARAKKEMATLVSGGSSRVLADSGRGEYQIVVVKTQAEAEELHRKITVGESFEDLARAHSVDPSAALGGFLHANPSELNEELRAQLARLPSGGLSPVFGLRRQWAIVRKIRDP
jgi:parvulin-like peptidyl-prolyl isomerase